MIQRNPNGDIPHIHKSAFIDPSAFIIGKVKIGRDVFVAPGAIIRADEPGSSIAIGADCNVQDRVVIHALAGSSVRISEKVSLAHGCIVHGPCKIGENCFVGFGSVVFNSELEDSVIVRHLSCLEGVKIPSARLIESQQLVNMQEKAKKLHPARSQDKEFAENVIKANLELTKGYRNG